MIVIQHLTDLNFLKYTNSLPGNSYFVLGFMSRCLNIQQIND